MDYEYIKGCEYGIPSEEDVVGCGEAGYAKIWWKHDQSDIMTVCENHFNYILETEEGEE